MKPTLSVTHSLAGRVRLKFRGPRSNQRLVEACRKLDDLEGVLRIRANPACASLVVHFDDSLMSPADIARLARGAQGGPRLMTPSAQEAAPCRCPRQGSAQREHPMRKPALRFLGLSGVGAWALIRSKVMGLSMAQGLFSPLGLVTLAAALPMILASRKEKTGGKLSLEGFLGGSIILASTLGEAMTALEILWIDSAAGLLKAWIGERSRKAISEILQVTSQNTYILVDGLEVEVPVEQVQIGDTVVLHTGEKIAVDGLVTRGEALVDESPINGRAEFVLRSQDDQVFAGTFVRTGVIYVRAEKIGDQTYLARVLAIVEDSLENKAPIQGVADDLARKLIRLGAVATLGTLVVTRSFWRAFTVLLVMACPCATVLAASTAISAAISAAARRNILIKGGRYLEEVGKVKTACFDKTGTITSNHPTVERVTTFKDTTPEELLYLVASAEVHNQHPLARAVNQEAVRAGLTPGRHAVCEYFLGLGVRAELEGRQILVGSRKLMKRFQVSLSRAGRAMQAMEERGLTTLLVARDGQLLGCLGLANPPKPETAWMLDRLGRGGVERKVMITGDTQSSAQALCRQMDFDECFYSVMPEEKARIAQQLKEKDGGVLMVGDGINDALALAQADVGVAMGAGGTEVAIEAADIALVNDDLKGLVYVHSLSQATMRVVRQNFWLATGSNLAGIGLGAMGLLSPVAAGFLHILHTLGILLNSSRLLSYEPDRNNPMLRQADRARPELESEEKNRALAAGNEELVGAAAEQASI